MWWLLAACSGSDDVSLDGSETGTGDGCEGATPFTEGVSATTAGTGATVEIVSADPNPPDVGVNLWVLRVSDASGPLTGLAPLVTPWMPLHDHGVFPADYTGADLGDGTYDLPPFDLIMPGLWEFTVDLAPDAAEGDKAIFRFCAEG